MLIDHCEFDIQVEQAEYSNFLTEGVTLKTYVDELAKNGTYADLSMSLNVVQGGAKPDITMGDPSAHLKVHIGYLSDLKHYVNLKQSV